MKIKLAILEKDQSYLSRIVSAFSTKYADKLQIYSFTNPELAMSSIQREKIDVLIASDVFDIDLLELPSRCGFAYFVDSVGVETLNDQRAICKFQKAELIYKQILGVYSDHATNIGGVGLDEKGQILLFASPAGGAGSSTMAAACALHFAQAGRKTLYLNLEKFGASDLFFSAEGSSNLSDVIFALKTKKSNLTLKVESCVRQDANGVYYFASPKQALDMLELTTEETRRLLSAEGVGGSYDVIVLDMDFSLAKDYRDVYRLASAWIVVSDGSEIANDKVFRAYNALSIQEEREDSSLNRRMALLYNRVNSYTGSLLQDLDLRSLGGAPRYAKASVQEIVKQLSTLDAFDKIVS